MGAFRIVDVNTGLPFTVLESTITRCNFRHLQLWKLYTAHVSRLTSYIKAQGSSSPWNIHKSPMFRVLRPRFATSSNKPQVSSYLMSSPLQDSGFLFTMETYTRLRCFASYDRVSQHRRCPVDPPCVSPSPMSHGGDCLSVWCFLSICLICTNHTSHLLFAQNASLHHLFRMGDSDYLEW
jgi:hypothetical protein